MDLRFGKIGRGLCAGLIYTALGIGANPALADPALRALATGEMAGVALLEAPLAVPDVAFAAPDGTDRRLADWRGEVVVLNFWATWCAPCRAEMPSLDALAAAQAGRGVAVLAVATGRNPPDAIARFYAEAEIAHLPVLTDRGSALARAMGVMGLPATVLIDREGRELGRIVGEADWNAPEAHALIEALRTR
jgi:thiol-disulfide isomerase/thioredoxin